VKLVRYHVIVHNMLIFLEVGTSWYKYYNDHNIIIMYIPVDDDGIPHIILLFTIEECSAVAGFVTFVTPRRRRRRRRHRYWRLPVCPVFAKHMLFDGTYNEHTVGTGSIGSSENRVLRRVVIKT